MTGAQVIATVGYVGYLRPASGTWGSAAGLVLAWVIATLGGVWALALAIPAVFYIGLKATETVTANGDDEDPSEVVVDEVVGQWIALFPTILAAGMMDLALLSLWPGWVAAFVLFRLFDVWKPWLAGQADARGDAMGVMLDDVWAGIFAAVAGVLLAILAHAVLL